MTDEVPADDDQHVEIDWDLADLPQMWPRRTWFSQTCYELPGGNEDNFLWTQVTTDHEDRPVKESSACLYRRLYDPIAFLMHDKTPLPDLRPGAAARAPKRTAAGPSGGSLRLFDPGRHPGN